MSLSKSVRRIGVEPLPRQRVIDLQRDAQATPLVDHRQHPELPSAGQLIMDEIHGPVLVAAGRHRHWPAVQSDSLAPTHSHTNLESLQFVQALHPAAADSSAVRGASVAGRCCRRALLSRACDR